MSLDETPLGSLCYAILQVVEDAVLWAAEADDQDDLLERFGLIDDALAALKDAHEEVGREVIASCDDGDQIPSGGSLRFGGAGVKRVYDVPRLQAAVTAACAAYVGMEDDPRIEAVVEEAWAVAPATASAGFRVGGAKRLGIDLRDYREESVTRTTVRIESRRNADGTLIPHPDELSWDVPESLGPSPHPPKRKEK